MQARYASEYRKIAKGEKKRKKKGALKMLEGWDGIPLHQTKELQAK